MMTQWAGAMRIEYEDTQEEIENGIEWEGSSGDDNDFYESSEYQDWEHSMMEEAIDNLSTSDKVDYISSKDEAKAMEWGYENIEEVAKYAEVDLPTANDAWHENHDSREERAEKAAAAGLDEEDIGELNAAEDRRVAMQERAHETLDAETEAKDAFVSSPGVALYPHGSHQEGGTENIKDHPEKYEPKTVDALKRFEEATAERARVWKEYGKAKEEVITTFDNLVELKDKDLDDTDRDRLTELNDEILNSSDVKAAWIEQTSEGEEAWKQPFYDDFSASEYGDSSDALEEWKRNNQSDPVTIDRDDWPITLTRNVDAEVKTYVPNFSESWAYQKEQSQFGHNVIKQEIDPQRVLVFQGAQHWRAKSGGMGTTENEFIVLSEPPSWIRAREAKEVLATTLGEVIAARREEKGDEEESARTWGRVEDRRPRARERERRASVERDDQGGDRRSRGDAREHEGRGRTQGRGAALPRAYAQEALKFDPNQPRDEQGQWTDGGGGGGAGEGKSEAGAAQAREHTSRTFGPTYDPDPTRDRDGDGVADASRVGVPADSIPPPPPIPRLPNLSDDERDVEESFAAAYEADPQGVQERFRQAVLKGEYGMKNNPPTFGTDDAKNLSAAWTPPASAGLTEEQVKENRAVYNLALHQTANAITKGAFVKQLDEIAKLPEDQRAILVTAGGCGAGKGYAIKNDATAGELQKHVGAVWDAAGDQNSTENPWLLKEAEKRGIKATFVWVDNDPISAWEAEGRGIVHRANKEGRMVEASVVADSYALGAQNFKAFAERNESNKHASFIYLDNSGKPKRTDGISDKVLKLDRKRPTISSSRSWTRRANVSSRPSGGRPTPGSVSGRSTPDQIADVLLRNLSAPPTGKDNELVLGKGAGTLGKPTTVPPLKADGSKAYARAREKDFDPNQPRDEQGRWEGEGGGGGGGREEGGGERSPSASCLKPTRCETASVPPTRPTRKRCSPSTRSGPRRTAATTSPQTKRRSCPRTTRRTPTHEPCTRSASTELRRPLPRKRTIAPSMHP